MHGLFALIAFVATGGADNHFLGISPVFSIRTRPIGAGLSGRRIAAMVVNDYACELDKRGALESIASRLAPTIPPECVKRPRPDES